MLGKKVFWVVTAVFLVSGLLLSAAACAGKSEPDYAASITESILIGMNQNDYVKFSESFDEDMKAALPESAFAQMLVSIEEEIGDYIPGSKSFWKVVTSGIYTDVFYKAEFAKSTDIIVHVSFHESEGKIYVNGFWFQ